MKRMRMLFVLLVLLILAAPALAEEDWPQPYTGELVGTWCFIGGGEVNGDGFRLNADGTGCFLKISDYEAITPVLTETGSAFTYEITQEDGYQVLHEHLANGREVSYRVERWGDDGRIHLPVGEGGGFYMPYLNDLAAAYLDEKTERSAFDGMLADYLDASIQSKLTQQGLRAGEIVLRQVDGAWCICISCFDAESEQEVLFRLTEESVGVYVDRWVSVWDDEVPLQPWRMPSTTADCYRLLAGIIDSSHALAAQAAESSAPTRDPLILSAVRGSFARNQSFAVYESPRGEMPRRAGNGKAKVSTNGEIKVYGDWLGALLVEYEISADRHRIGWIEAEMADAPELDFTDKSGDYLCGVVTASVSLTDDPLYSQERIAVMSGGTSVHVLGRLEDWQLVEGFIGEEVRMGFVPADAVDMEYGQADNARRVIDHAGRYTEEDIRAAMDALCTTFRAEWAGSALKEIRYVDADNADPARWWQEDGVEDILFYADLSSMELWDFEIAGRIARDYLFILYREPGGEWVVRNWGYT